MTDLVANIITSSSVWTEHCPLVVPFKVAYGATLVAQPCLVALTDARGQVGLGEGVPASSVAPSERQKAVTIAKEMAAQAIQRSPSEALERLHQDRRAVLKTYPHAFAAVELAILDLQAQQLGKPLHQLFGSADLPGCFTDITLPLMEVQDIPPFWRQFSEHQFPIVKIKVSGAIPKDLLHIRTLVELLPTGTQITLDGNQGFTLASALALLEQLAKTNGPAPLFFEQPLPKDDWEGAAALTARSPTPICLDETVTDGADAQRVVDQGVAPMINLKTMKSGFRETLKIIDIAARHHIGLMIGGMVESEIGMAGSLHLFCGTGKIQYADLDTPYFYRDRLTESSPWHGPSAWLKCPQASGLGLRLLPERLANSRR